MKKKTCIKAVLFALLINLVLGGLSTYANENEKGSEAGNTAELAGATGFTYQMIFPENQHPESGFFDLQMMPGQKQTVEINLKNPSSQELTVQVNLTGAMTNSNGVIEYGPNKLSADKSMKYKFADIVKGPESITLKPQSEERLKLEIIMPKTEFDGIILGGIQLQRQSNEEKVEDNSGTMVVNKYAYVIGMRLRENDKEIPKELEFVKAYADTPDYKNSVIIDLGNKQAAILKDLTVEAQIMGEKSDEVLYESKKTQMRMAPNTVLNFPVSMEGQAMKAGKYRAHVVATSGSERWEWTEKFEITKEEADKFNNEAIGLNQNREFDWKLIGLIVGGVLALIIIIFVVMHLIKKKKSKSKKKKRKN
ncbi:DUF916 and DUF3324 domain-containing protein [Candidatus Enterococcus mansonii]|uniref:DUF3324 domain-containing protein n=1 Tax=Candidatus Enterococcus mansonii TaxID=1834181 RepID=A0ABU8IGL7_9ENTE